MILPSLLTRRPFSSVLRKSMRCEKLHHTVGRKSANWTMRGQFGGKKANSNLLRIITVTIIWGREGMSGLKTTRGNRKNGHARVRSRQKNPCTRLLRKTFPLLTFVSTKRKLLFITQVCSAKEHQLQIIKTTQKNCCYSALCHKTNRKHELNNREIRGIDPDGCLPAQWEEQRGNNSV